MNLYVLARAYPALSRAGVAHFSLPITIAQPPRPAAQFAAARFVDCSGPA